MAQTIGEITNYDNAKSYRRLKDGCLSNGGIYMALSDVTGESPSDSPSKWKYIGAAKGENTVTIEVIADSEANFVSNNPVLASNVIAFTNDGDNKGYYKIGNGTSVWTDLSYCLKIPNITNAEIDEIFANIGGGLVAPTGGGGGNVQRITEAQIDALLAKLRGE